MKKIEGNISGAFVEYYSEEGNKKKGIVLSLGSNGNFLCVMSTSDYNWGDIMNGDVYDWDHLREQKVFLSDIICVHSREESNEIYSHLKEAKMVVGSWKDYLKSATAKKKRILEVMRKNKKFQYKLVITDEEKYDNVLVVWDEKEKEKVVDPVYECHSKAEVDVQLRKLLKDSKVVASSIRVYFYTVKKRVEFSLE